MNLDARLDALARQCWDSILDQVTALLQQGKRLPDLACVMRGGEGDATVGAFALVAELARDSNDPAFIAWTQQPRSFDQLRTIAIFPDGLFTMAEFYLDLPERFRVRPS